VHGAWYAHRHIRPSCLLLEGLAEIFWRVLPRLLRIAQWREGNEEWSVCPPADPGTQHHNVETQPDYESRTK
jgi:hypothetical protein